MLEHINYIISMLIAFLGLYTIISSGNLFKKLIGLSIFQTSAILLYVSLSLKFDLPIPILQDGVLEYTNPLPHVLMLTAIVVGVATFAVALSLIVRIKEHFGSIEMSQINKQ